MTKLIVDLHSLKTRLELNGCWFTAAEIGRQIELEIADLCYFCGKPVDANSIKNHPDCVTKLYDMVFEEKKAA